mgnify:CR=1 FL=1
MLFRSQRQCDVDLVHAVFADVARGVLQAAQALPAGVRGHAVVGAVVEVAEEGQADVAARLEGARDLHAELAGAHAHHEVAKFHLRQLAAKEAVIQGQVLRGGAGEPVPNAYVRLLDRSGEFTAEVPTSATGHFRFFAGDGEWTLRTLAPKADPVDKKVVAAIGSVAVAC